MDKEKFKNALDIRVKINEYREEYCSECSEEYCEGLTCDFESGRPSYYDKKPSIYKSNFIEGIKKLKQDLVAENYIELCNQDIISNNMLRELLRQEEKQEQKHDISHWHAISLCCSGIPQRKQIELIRERRKITGNFNKRYDILAEDAHDMVS